jgi:hypothetical protein
MSLKRKRHAYPRVSVELEDMVDILPIILSSLRNLFCSIFPSDLVTLITDFLFDFGEPIYMYSKPFAVEDYKRHISKLRRHEFACYFVTPQVGIYFSVGHEGRRHRITLPKNHGLPIKEVQTHRCVVRLIYGDLSSIMPYEPMLRLLAHKDGYVTDSRDGQDVFGQLVLWCANDDQVYSDTLPNCSDKEIHQHDYTGLRDFFDILGERMQMRCFPIHFSNGKRMLRYLGDTHFMDSVRMIFNM